MEIRLRSVAGRGLLVGTVLGSSLALLDGTVVNVALSHIGRDLHAPVGGLQWTVNAYMLPLAALVLIGGALGDRYGRRRMFLLGVAWFTGASVLCGLAPGIGWLVGARALQGIGSALLTPGSLALIQATIHPDDRARAIGLWAGLGGVATAIGPLLGGYLIDALSWRWIFYINVPLAVVTILVVLRYAPESRDQREDTAAHFDVTGSALGALGLGVVTYALVEGIVWAGLVGAAMLAAFVWYERWVKHPMMPPVLFRSVEFSVINAVTLLYYGAAGGLIFFLVLQLQISTGFSALAAGAAGLPLTVLLLLGSSRAGALGKRIGARLPLSVGGALAAVGIALLVPVGQGSTYWADVFGPITLMGVGFTLLVAPLTATVLAAAPDAFAGLASGINNAVARSGSLLAVAALPLVAGLSGDEYKNPVAFTHSYQIAMWCCAGLFAVGALLSFVLLPRHGAVRAAAAAEAASQ